MMVPPVPNPEQKPSMAMPAAQHIGEDLRGVPFHVGCQVVAVHELLGHEHARVLCGHPLGERDALLDAGADVALVVDADHLGAVMLHDAPALHRAGVRHDDAGRIALHRRHKGESHALGCRSVGSTMMESGPSSPRSSARSIIFSAVRVFTEPPTFTASNFTSTWASSGPGHAPQPHERRRSHGFQNVIADHSFP